MALTDNEMVMPVSPMGGGMGSGFGGDWGWIILLLLIAGGGFGGFGGGDNVYPWMNQSNLVNEGFRDSMLNTSVNGIQNAVTSGFGDVQTALCGGFAGVNASVNGAQNGITSQLYSNTIADLERSFAAQTANTAAINGLSSQLSECCCANRLATVETQNVVQREGAATRLAIQEQTQAILDKMCQDKIDAKNEKIVELNNRINALESNNYISNALTAQTQYFLGLYPPPTTVA